MKIKTLLFLLISTTTLTFAQKLKKVSLSRNIGCTTSKEVFYVLEDNPEIRQGNYKQTTPMFDVNGQYENGFRSGVWEYSTRQGIVQRYDFTNHKVLLTPPDPGQIKSWIVDDQGNAVKELNEFPMYLGGPGRFYSYLGRCSRFPAEATRARKDGAVRIFVIINKQGKMVNPVVMNNPGYGYAEAALQALSMVPDEWIPYEVDGKPVDVRLEIKVNFAIGR